MNKKELKSQSGLLGAHPKLGFLGAGQLGKMLAQAASRLDFPLYFLDKSKDFPAIPLAADYLLGDFNNYEDVLNFGRQMDIISIEIEHVNTDALLVLEQEGKVVHPNASSLIIIKDKGKQKEFFKKRNYPSSPFHLFSNKEEILQAIKVGIIKYPFVQKSRSAGYDGKGVEVINSENDDLKIMDLSSLIEPKVSIAKELAIIASRNSSGEIRSFPMVEMEFDPKTNLVEFLFCPAAVSESIKNQATQIAEKLILDFDICGLLAVEFFLSESGELLINEVAPRPHNSGHHTIDANVCSQFEQHLRGILNLPLGDTSLMNPAVMINLLGEEGYKGPVKYTGVEDIMKESGVHLHLYGKKETRPNRKMGHATVVNSDLETAKREAKEVQKLFKIIS